MKIFDYSKKIKIILGSIMLVVIILLIVFIIIDRSRVKDLQLVSQIKTFATALEQYYDKFQTYPVTSEIDLAQVQILTDQGFNQPSEVIYYQAQSNWARPVLFLSSDSHYTIKFDLKNSWPVWQLETWRGGECHMSNNMIMTCQNID